MTYICPEGLEYEKKVGRKTEVFEATAYQTSSGLKKDDLKLSKRGKVVSKLRSQRMAERYKQFGGLTPKTKEQIKLEAAKFAAAVKLKEKRESFHKARLQKEMHMRLAGVRKKRHSLRL